MTATKIRAGTLQWWMERGAEGWICGKPVIERISEAYHVTPRKMKAALGKPQVIDIPGWYPCGNSNDWKAVVAAAKIAGITRTKDIFTRLAMVQVFEGKTPYIHDETKTRKWMGKALEDAGLVVVGCYDIGVTLDLLPDESQEPGHVVVSLVSLA